jgi:DNA replication licensing factor MCM3
LAVISDSLYFLKAVAHEDPAYGKTSNKTLFHVGFQGSFGANMVSPRELSSSYICQLVCVEGIITKCSLVRPKVVESVHYCAATNNIVSRVYRDVTSTDGLPTPAVYPTKDENGNPLETEYGLSSYKDHQNITIQEMPERAPHGQLPRSVDIVLDNDLVDKCKPGDRVQIVGIYRALANSQGSVTSSVFKNVIVATNLSVIGVEVSRLQIQPEDITNVRSISKRDDVADLLARSLAPSIYGHDTIKKALLLQMLGGTEKVLENGTHLRGDVNVLMIGDPSTAKSQLLRFCLNISPLAVNTTGRGSSGVGLTAAVTSDPETGERRLEAGAMVMADRGLVCIDEFDKMSEADRVAIHEVMEQQTVTIAKAGIHASLNARCSVLAAANPVYGQYDRNKRPQENIGLPDSLLSRFDLLFVVLDTPKPSTDKMISDHVLRAHRYQRPGQEGVPLRMDTCMIGTGNEDDEEAQQVASAVWEKYNPLLHGGAGQAAGDADPEVAAQKRAECLLTIDFVKKYIHYAKNRVKPQLTDPAREIIADNYATLRSKQNARTLPVTARSLETLIRLSTAHAKLRLSTTVDEVDAEVAVDMINFALYHEIDEELEQESNESTENDGQENEGDRRNTNKRNTGGDDTTEAEGDRKKRKTLEEGVGAEDPAEEAAVAVDKSSARYQTCTETVVRMMSETHGDNEVRVEELIARLNEEGGGAAKTFGRSEVGSILIDLEKDNRVMYRNGLIFQI